jgi:hypothetical protein
MTCIIQTKISLSLRVLFERKQSIKHLKADSLDHIQRRVRMFDDIQKIKEGVTNENAKSIFEELKKVRNEF